MGSGMLVEDGKDFKAEFLVEARGLETVGSQDHLLATSPPRFVLCGVEQFRPETMAARRLLHPYRLDVTAATPGPAFEPCMDGLLVVSEKNRQPLSVIHACLFHAVFVEAVFQKSDVLGRRIRFNNKMFGVHSLSLPRGGFSCTVALSRPNMKIGCRNIKNLRA